MEQNRVFDIVINLLMGINNQDRLVDSYAKEEQTLTECKYLLNQVIRQYQLPQDHYFVSKKAQALWDKVSTDSIFDYTYRERAR